MSRQNYKIIIDIGEQSKEGALFYMEELLRALVDAEGAKGLALSLAGARTLESFLVCGNDFKYYLASDDGYILSGDPKVLIMNIAENAKEDKQ